MPRKFQEVKVPRLRDSGPNAAGTFVIFGYVGAMHFLVSFSSPHKWTQCVGNERAEWRFECLVFFSVVLEDALVDRCELLLSILITIFQVLKPETFDKWKSQNTSFINLALISFIDYLDKYLRVYYLLLQSHLMQSHLMTLAHMEVCCPHVCQVIAGRIPSVFALPTTLLGTVATSKFNRTWEYPFSPFTSTR